MTQRYRSRQFTPRPEVIETPQDRGQAMRNWLDVQQLSIKAFAAALGMSRSRFTLYLDGGSFKGKVYDLAEMDQEEAERLMTAMNVTDYEAWEILGIPEANRQTFRSFRPPPWGHGSPVRDVIEVLLQDPMVGEVPLPAGAIVRIDPQAQDAKFQVVRLEDGRLYSVGPLMLGRAGGEHLGGLLSAHF